MFECSIRPFILPSRAQAHISRYPFYHVKLKTRRTAPSPRAYLSGASMAELQTAETSAPNAAPAAEPERIPAKNLRMGTEPVGKLLLEFAPPTILAVMCTTLYNVINTIFLGQGVGSDAVAATTVAFPIMTVMNAFAMWFGAGGNARAALKMGEGKIHEAELCLGNTIFLNLTVCAAASVVMLAFLDQLLYLCGCTPELLEMARTYTGVLVAGFVIQAIGPSLNNFIRTDGSPTWALITMASGCAASVFFNWLFVMVLSWGVFGGALGTLLGQLTSGCVVLGYFMSSRSSMKLRLANIRPHGPIISGIVGLGVASFAMQLAAALISTLLNQQIWALGATDPIGVEGGLAVIGSLNKIVQMCCFAILGIGIAVQPIEGFNYGARHYDRVRRALWVAVGSSTVLAVAILAVVIALRDPILASFGLTPAEHTFGMTASVLFIISMPVVPLAVIGSNYFQATGQPMKAMFLSLTRQFIFYVPLLYVMPALAELVAPGTSGLMAITFTESAADFLAVLFVAVFQALEGRRIARLQHGQSDGSVPSPVDFSRMVAE